MDINKLIKFTKTLKVLYIEDNAEARESTLMILEEFFDDMLVAIDGQDGFENFQRYGVDLIITDINMPRLNGLEMIKKIRTFDKDVPILILSAYNESGFFIDSIKLGVEGYLLKPIDMKQFLGVLKKVTEKLMLKAEVEKNISFLHQYQEATDHSAIVSKTDINGCITYVNDKFCKIYGYSKDELIGKNHNIIRHPDNPSLIYEDMWNTIKNKKQIHKMVVRNIAKDGKSYYVKAVTKPILDVNGEIIEFIAIRNDITEIMSPKKQLDDLIASYKEPLVVYLKIEDFDTLEGFYSNTTVEIIQEKIARYLESSIAKKCNFDKIFQLGNGEYAMVNEKNECFSDENIFIDELKKYQDNLRDHIVDIGDVEYGITVLISLAYGKDKVLESSKLGIKKLLRNKQDFIISNNFAQIEQENAKKNLDTISLIKTAISSSNIILYFQPIVNNRTKEVEKFESLVRLVSQDGEVLSPFFFLDISKRGKYYSQITKIVLKRSFDALKQTDKDISINISALDIEKRTTREFILELLEQNLDYTHRVVFELLEDENVKNFKTISKFICNVKKLGVKIAIDDFGAGYSNFERLLDYQPDILKIDGCLIRDILTNNYSLSVVKTIIAFAKEQNIKIIAEYVENEEIYCLLNSLGVDYSQGYYFGKPSLLESAKS